MDSFEITVSKVAKPIGKVFARKRPEKAPAKQNQEKKPAPKPKFTLKPAESPAVTEEPSKNTTAAPEKPTFAFKQNRDKGFRGSKPEFVKRKQKKDKLAAKNTTPVEANEDAEETAVRPVKTYNQQQSANHSLFAGRKKDIYVNTNVPGRSVVEEVFSAGRKFSDLNVHRHLVSNLEKRSFTILTNVQEKSIPVVTSGKNALIRSQTGSGKTLAYAVPIIDALQGIEPRIQRKDGVQAIIVVPTRELAMQVHELFTKICTFQWVVVGHLCGGENRNTEKNRLRKGVHILIATPGRLLDHISHTSSFKINNVRCLVLDEADRLLDMGFKKDIVRIVEELDKSKINAEYDPMGMLKRGKNLETSEPTEEKYLPPLKNISSKNRQTVLLSATLTKGIAELADFTMKEHVYVDALEEFKQMNPDHMVIPNTVKQEFVMTYVKHRLFTLSAILLAKARNSKIFVFMATGQMVDYHYELFTKYLARMPKNRGKLKSGDVVVLDDYDDSEFEGSDEDEEAVIEADFYKLHGSMDQSSRKEVFTAFRAAKKGVLLCTDVAARGVDVPEADCIIQYTGPQSDEDYLHRVGRTGRAGKKGSSLIFLTHEEQTYISNLQQHKIFLKEHKSEDFLKHLCDVMEEPDEEKAATALQRRFENAVKKDSELHRMACFAYSSWSRFYNTYPGKMRTIFDFKNVNLGHYVTSFALQETPSSVAKIVRGQVSGVQPRRLNKKLANHSSDEKPVKTPQKRKIKSISLNTSEFSSGLEPTKKKKKK